MGKNITATIGRSVTDFTAVRRRKGSLFLLRVRAAEIDPKLPPWLAIVAAAFGGTADCPKRARQTWTQSGISGFRRSDVPRGSHFQCAMVWSLARKGPHEAPEIHRPCRWRGIAWPLIVRAQQPGPVRRVGLMNSFREDDPNARARVAAFQQVMEKSGERSVAI